MAKRTGTILAGVFVSMFCVSLWAQQKGRAQQPGEKTGKDTTAAHGKKKAVKPLVYLGHSNFSGGPISPQQFDSLLKQGVSSHDETGLGLKVLGFQFNYAERRLFENEAGDLTMQIDFSTEYCPGDTITTNISSTIYDRIKTGDTVYISQVMLEKRIGSQTDTISGREMKCVIKK